MLQLETTPLRSPRKRGGCYHHCVATDAKPGLSRHDTTFASLMPELGQRMQKPRKAAKSMNSDLASRSPLAACWADSKSRAEVNQQGERQGQGLLACQKRTQAAEAGVGEGHRHWKGDSVSRRCRRHVLLGRGPCELAKDFASMETRRHDVGRAPAAQSRPRLSSLLRLHCTRATRLVHCFDENLWAGKRSALFTGASSRSPRGVASML